MRIHLVSALIFLALSGLPTSADQWAPAKPRIFASQEGTIAFKTLLTKPPSSKAVGVLFSLDKEGKENVSWRKPLVNTPVRAFVANNGFVVTTDTWGHAGHEHALVIYGKQGPMVADFALEDLLTPMEINARVTQFRPTSGSRWWTNKAELSFDGDQEPQHVLIRFQWGKTIKIELATGKVR